VGRQLPLIRGRRREIVLPQIVINADVGQWLRGLGARVTDTLFHPSGWTIPDDTDTGISFGEAIDVGGGYMEMDLKDIRHPSPQPLYELRGGYAEVGVGIGEISKFQGLINKIVKWIPKGARPSSDFVALPGGSISQLIMGPAHAGKVLEVNDFRLSSWAYVHIGGEVAVLSGDVGLIYMIDHKLAVDLVKSLITQNVNDLAQAMFMHCIAWAPYYGFALGLGAGGKVALRIIQTVHLKNA
jgi:hypothetical protein